MLVQIEGVLELFDLTWFFSQFEFHPPTVAQVASPRHVILMELTHIGSSKKACASRGCGLHVQVKTVSADSGNATCTSGCAMA
mmetsp:Transcript_30987/g.78485  ORF Transcript_30987/g.78485 Transcript_30987/m.78485 type:complete len:83 (-) Transcript_30987:73-321(-)